VTKKDTLSKPINKIISYYKYINFTNCKKPLLELLSLEKFQLFLNLKSAYQFP